jgi:uncharacterized surface protein with fasciclin (FAS1) repeats
MLFLLVWAAQAAAQEAKSILTILAEDGRFTTLLATIELTETEQAFSEGSWTLFAPTDAAFAELGLNADNIAEQLSLGETVDLLLYQAMTKAANSDEAKQMLGDVTMANGWLAGLKWYEGSLWVNDVAKVTEPDILANNGVIQVVDQVITPPWPRSADTSEIGLMAAIEEAKLLMAEETVTEEGEESEITVEEASSEEEPMAEQVTEGAEESEMAEEEPSEEELTEASAAAVSIPAGSVLDVMVKDGRFTTYLEAVGDLDLVMPYTEGEWTIFAPTDAAFAAVGLDASNISSEFGVAELADLLLYHALDEEISADKAKTMLGDITMRNGQIAGIKFFEGDLWLNDNARVVDADIVATNGIIHALGDIIERPWPRVEAVTLEATTTLQAGDTP